MEIKRDRYLRKLQERMHNGLIKVITGIRRCGKSYLLCKLFRDYLLSSGVTAEQIIMLELDVWQNRIYRDPDTIMSYITSKLTDTKQYYLFIDEVQLLAHFEEVLNSLLHLPQVDIYVTGSNSRFLSSDVLTQFRGRGDEVHLYPLSFSEFMAAYDGDRYSAWAEYVTYGGLPLLLSMRQKERKAAYLEDLFKTTYLKDIVERQHLTRTQEFNDLLDILASCVGSLTNAPRIAATFQSKIAVKISVNTIRQYIEYLKDAFIIREAQRYDVKGRKYIGSPLKYYFEDVGLRNARQHFRQMEENHLMENIIYNELCSRDYLVDVGVVVRRTQEGSKSREYLEIDFVANKGSKRCYIQSALALPDAAKCQQEKASLLRVGDSFSKFIIVKDVVIGQQDENGITLMSVFDFLLKEDSLE